MDCLTPDAIEALSHPNRPVIESRLTEAPPNLGHLPEHPAPPGAKSVYGGVYTNHLETTNFTINWEEGKGSLDAAQSAGDALEAAWTYFVDEHGWTPPVSSDQFYIWVFLVDDLSGTGLTTEYYTDEFPEGYPVIFLTSSWATDVPFWRSLAEHEFHHTLQFAVRDWNGNGGGSETWYWEASATWAAALVEPDSAALDYIVPWYGDQPAVRFDDTGGSHQYGMFVFNGWLDDTLGQGPGTMQAVWTKAISEPAATWDTILADTTGRPASELFGGFGAAFGNDTYARGPIWQDPALEPLTDGLAGGAQYLGTHYYAATERIRVTAEADGSGTFLLTAPSEPSGSSDGSVIVEAGERLAVTATSDPGARWTLHTADPDAVDSGEDSGLDADSGQPRSDGDGDGDGDGDEPADVGCGCASAPGGSAALVLSLAAVVAVARRRVRGPDGPQA